VSASAISIYQPPPGRIGFAWNLGRTVAGLTTHPGGRKDVPDTVTSWKQTLTGPRNVFAVTAILKLVEVDFISKVTAEEVFSFSMVAI